MKNLSLAARAASYAEAFPDWPAPRTDARWLDGMWLMGNNYKATGHDARGRSFYGAYPPGHVKRVLALFPDHERLLHLFSGSLPGDPSYARFNNELSPVGRQAMDREGQAESLSSHYPPGTFDLVMADPPYSTDDAKHYGTLMVNRRRVLGEVYRVLEPGGHLVWLDTQLPMFRKDLWSLWGLIGVVRSTNHRVRLISFFQRRADADMTRPLPDSRLSEIFSGEEIEENGQLMLPGLSGTAAPRRLTE